MEFKVILLCLKPYMSPCQVTEDTLRNLFGKFDGFVNLSIFQREVVVKAFVEFETAAAAQRVISQFAHQTFSIGSLRVYPSNKQSVKLKFDKSKTRTPENSEETNLKTNASYSQNLGRENYVAPTGSISPLSEDQHHHISKSKISIGKGFDFSPTPHLEDESVHLQISYKSLNVIAPKRSSALQLLIKNEGFKTSDFKNKKQSSEVLGQSFAIQLKNINFRVINQKILINLLCCFGNLNRIFLNASSWYAIAIFQSKMEASTAIFYLNNQLFFGYHLQAESFSLDCLDPNSIDDSGSGLQLLEVPNQFNRYKQALNIKFNAPSTMLHFTNLSPNCTPPLLFEIIRAIQEPVKIMRLCKKASNSSIMMLVQFDCIYKSIEVLSVLHNKVIDNLPIRISFSQTKVN